jgi:biotin carboxyl carrier protein
MFGTLALLHVEDGATVTEGEALCEIEAMKTFLRVPAPTAGSVRWLVELGETVGEDDEIAEIVP